MLPKNAYRIDIQGYRQDIDYTIVDKGICYDIVNISMVGRIAITYFDSGCMCQRKRLFGEIVDGVLVLD